jgi:hypothetical protein
MNIEMANFGSVLGNGQNLRIEFGQGSVPQPVFKRKFQIIEDGVVFAVIK